jgi:branched-chain amino acid transport system permease protein
MALGRNVVGLGATALLFSMFLPRGIWGSLEDRFGIRLLPMGYRLKSAGAPNLTGRSGELSNLRSDKAREAPAVPPDTWQSLP